MWPMVLVVDNDDTKILLGVFDDLLDNNMAFDDKLNLKKVSHSSYG